MADQYAKKATERSSIDMEIKYSKAEIKSIVKDKLRGKWQKLWDSEPTGRHFYNIQKNVGGCRNVHRNTQEEDVISRMRLGHTGLNSTLFLMKKHADGTCSDCNTQETIEHVIESCNKYQYERQKLLRCLEAEHIPLRIRGLLQRQSEETCYSYLFLFLRETGLLRRI